jgi:hypothetical protein
MKTTVLLSSLCTIAALASTSAQAASVTLRYGFKDGATYLVKQQYHNVGSSTTTMNIMGNQQTMESPMNHTSSSSWSAMAKRKGGKVVFQVDYGKQQGGERWGDPSGNTGGKIYGNSSASVTFDLQKGMVSLTTKPADDPIVDIIYRSRFAWMPPLPKKALKVGGSFTYDYTMQSGMITMKGEDEYVLDEVKGGFAYFTVETRSVMVYDYSKLYKQQEGMPQGMGQMMGSMTLAHKGEGTATFDLKEGMFVEREMKTAYTTKKSKTPGMTITDMHGTTRDRWEMERR